MHSLLSSSSMRLYRSLLIGIILLKLCLSVGHHTLPKNTFKKFNIKNSAMGFDTLNNCTADQSADFYQTLFDNKPFKIVFVVFSVIVSLINIPTIYGIIWFERSGSDLKRMFINKTVSSVCWTMMAWLILVQIPDTIRYFSRPFSQTFCLSLLTIKVLWRCHFHITVKATMQALNEITGVNLTKLFSA
jgi:hypothetical protein